jgi:hypothetical protein
LTERSSRKAFLLRLDPAVAAAVEALAAQNEYKEKEIKNKKRYFCERYVE